MIFIVMFVVVGMTIAIFSETRKSFNISSEEVTEVLKEQISSNLPFGTTLLYSDEDLTAKDYTITHSSNQEETTIWIWDFAAEDGDYVQVIVNGTPINDPFFIKNKPAKFTIPTVGIIQVKGVRDGGGGITYAIGYELNNTTYFNSAPEGEMNTYTLVLGG